MPPLWPPEGIIQVNGDDRVAALTFVRGLSARDRQRSASRSCSPGGSRLGTVCASITGSGHQGSHEFARHAAMLPFVGHEDRDVSGARAYGATAAMPRSSTAITPGRRMIDVTCSSPEALEPGSIAASV